MSNPQDPSKQGGDGSPNVDDISSDESSIPPATSSCDRDDEQQGHGSPHDDSVSSDESSRRSSSSSRDRDDEVEENSTSRNDDAGIDDMEKLRMLCFVLDINYNCKLDEEDVRPGDLTPESRSRLQKAIDKLEETKERRFNELQELGRELMRIWTKNHVTLSKGINMTIVYSIVSALSSKDIIGEKFLSSNMIKKVKAEIGSVNGKIAAKYLLRKKKFEQMMCDTQLFPADVSFDPDEQVVNLNEASERMKLASKDLKSKVLDRKELILIIDSVKIAIDNEWPLEVTKGLLDKANRQVRRMKHKSKEAYVAYNGDDVSIVLQNFLTVAIAMHDKSTEDQIEHCPKLSKTRSGANFKPESSHAPKETQSENSASDKNIEDWMKIDKKKMLNVSYDVRDLKNAIECCTKGIGMKLLGGVGGDSGDTSTQANLGFGSEHADFALRLQLNRRASKHGLGHVKVAVSNVRKVIGKIKSLPGCGAFHEPRTFRGGSYPVSHIHDSNGTVFELTEKKPVSDMVCGIMIHVTNLDVSVKFYTKVLGMSLISRKCETCVLGYDMKDSKAAVLELKVDSESIKGHAYKLTIETDDIIYTRMVTETLCEEFGGQVLQGASILANNISVLDPDNWHIVMVQRVVREADADIETGQ